MQEDVGEYRNRIHFIPQMHGGIMFIRKDKTTQEIYDLALQVAQDYSKYRFKYFEKPADEPILALSMAVKGCQPIEKMCHGYPTYLFYPTAQRVKQNIRKGQVLYTQDGVKWIDGAMVIHWQNVYTEKPLYKIAVDSMSLGKGILRNASIILKWPLYYIIEWNNNTVLRIVRGIKRRFI